MKLTTLQQNQIFESQNLIGVESRNEQVGAQALMHGFSVEPGCLWEEADTERGDQESLG